MDKIIVIPLGTVSPYCKNKMNCPGFLIKHKRVNLLLDCGNGITGLMRFPDDLIDLNVIITHFHKDHIGDIGALQYATYVWGEFGFLENKIKVLLPKDDYQNNKQAILNNTHCFMDYEDIDLEKIYEFGSMLVKLYDNKSHSINSYVVKIQTNKLSLVYTSDIGCSNFDELVEFSKGADLLICESSFLKRHNSNSTVHMTAYDAGVLAKEAQVNRLLLTHFWPEEDKMAYLKEAKTVFDNVDIAREGKKLILKK